MKTINNWIKCSALASLMAVCSVASAETDQAPESASVNTAQITTTSMSYKASADGSDDAYKTITTTSNTARVNLNTASAAELTLLKGVGASKAEAIVRHREEHGPFANLEELAQVRGIGTATIEKNRQLATVD